MALQSQLFRGDMKLDAAAVSDPAHILQGARGTHVAKIQQALNKVDSAALDPDGAFGPATAGAVRGFKTKRKIVNFQGKIDDIVGKKTIATLDSEMLAKERSSQGRLGNIKPGVFRAQGKPPVVIMPSFKPSEIARAGVAASPNGAGRRFGVNNVGDPSLQSLNPLVVVNFTEAPNTFILSKSVELPGGTDGKKNDLDFSNPPKPPLNATEQGIVKAARGVFLAKAVASGTTELDVLQQQAMFEARNGGGGADGVALMETFFKNDEPTLKKRFEVGSSLSNRVANSQGFARELAGVTADITSAVQAQFLTGIIDFNKMRGIPRPVAGKPQAALSNLNGVKGIVEVGYDLSERDLVALIGSFQAATVFLNRFDVDVKTFTFQATLRFELLDHFGIDNGDLIPDVTTGHGTPGQIAVWMLQHEQPSRHTPYRFVVVVEKTITGTLLDPNLFPPTDFADLLRRSGVLQGL